ncbi:cytochrome P450 [Gymnopus androsaceus JB14]|uniref:Cytochrome P450 n=1 Tax=Gymnopus androsaceus JB14 TaxID=1447944 RepID=A0A6A4GVK5_9AGAR|nr:cytochrome P450 [Gymnopus androsaceus JB14]
MLDYIPFNFPYHFLLFLSLALFSLLSLTIVFVFFVTNIKANREHGIVPKSLPWVGRQQGQLFSAIRSNFRGLVNSVTLFREGYTKHSKKDQIYVVPTWTKGPQVIIPPKMNNWLASRPDAMLNAKDSQFAYTVGHPEITSNDMIDILIKRELTRTIGTLNTEIFEEVEASMEGLFGDGEWKQVGVFDSLTRTVGRAANRVFVGKELCSNMDFVMAGVSFARDILGQQLYPPPFPQVYETVTVSLFATMPNRHHSGIAMKYLQPLIQQRLDDMNRKQTDSTFAFEEPNDFITWMIRESLKRNTDDERSVHALAYRVVLLNFAAITTSTIMATNALLDIYSAPNSESLVTALREEASDVFREHNGQWTKAALAKLYRLDSAIRESARVSGVGGTSMARRVRADDGITLPDGTWIPHGATVGVSMDGIHFDEAFYENPSEFDAFRFSRRREEHILSGDEKTRANEDLVTTSAHWLPFSHGIHACPGRFFAANNIKMILAHLLLNYDVQPFDSRPPNISIGDISVVPVKATMMVRRREIKA